MAKHSIFIILDEGIADGHKQQGIAQIYTGVGCRTWSFSTEVGFV
jgi:hypothetical protein